MADAPAISVVVPARDASATLDRTLRALAAQDLAERFEVIVVDDGSRDGTAELARAFGPPVRVLASPAPGAAAARDAGLRAATGAIVAFTDADCFPVPGWLAAGVGALRAADLVQGPIVPDPSAARGPFDRTLDVPGRSAWWATANLFARRREVLAAGGFETVALDDDEGGRRQPLGEDTLLAWRLLRRGARPGFAPEAIVHHAVFPRDARGYVRYHRHWQRLPEVVRAVPELRAQHLYRRVFLQRRTAFFDASVCGLLLAARGRRLGLLAALPYAYLVAAERRAWPATPAWEFAAARVGADAVAAAALARGSLRSRTPVL